MRSKNDKMNREKLIISLCLLAIISFLFALFPNTSLAADLKIISAGDYYKVGDQFSVNVQVSSPDEASNAIYGLVDYPSNKLQVTSISKSGSVINLWVQEPSYSNTQGQVTFEGAILNPGFTGPAGRIITINFKAKAAGTAKIFFLDGSILANDGQGTNILKKLGLANINIVAKEDITNPPVTEEEPVQKDDKKSVTEKVATTTVVAPVADTTAPELDINEVKSPLDDRTSFVFSGTDLGSGIDHYEFQLDGAAVQNIPDDGTNLYNTPALNTGYHTLIAVAIDKAGNRTKKQLSFTIDLPIVNSVWANWGRSAIFAMSIMVPLVCLLIIILAILILGWQKLIMWKKRMRREVREMEDSMHKTFDLIREDLQDHVALLEKAKSKRKLTLVEKKLLKTIKTDLTEAEKYLKKEIEDIEKQIN